VHRGIFGGGKSPSPLVIGGHWTSGLIDVLEHILEIAAEDETLTEELQNGISTELDAAILVASKDESAYPEEAVKLLDNASCRMAVTNINCDYQTLSFPEASGININMMPIVLQWDPDEMKLPEEYHAYKDMIFQCLEFCDEALLGTVAYLTINETMVDAGNPQRRGGIHSDCQGLLEPSPSWEPQVEFTGWGGGVWFPVRGKFHGGIFMASNVEDSCRVWDAKVDKAAIGHMGSLEHLRQCLCLNNIESFTMVPNKMYWMTDCTPHESLPLQTTQHRSYIRLVVGKVTHWYEKHSTSNPLGVLPDAEVITADKFA